MSKGKSETSQEGFNLLEESMQHKQVETGESIEKDIYNLLGNLKLQYNIKKSKNNKTNITISLQSKEQLMMLLNNIGKIQNAVETTEYVTVPIAQRHPYTLTLVITKNNAILKIAYLSGYIKNVNMSIPISANTINSLQAILTALSNSELGKKLLSVSSLNTSQNSSENLL